MALSEQMRRDRLGKFTASQFYRLMGGSAGYVTCDFTDSHTCYERVKSDDGFIYVPMQEAHKTKKAWKKDNSFLPEGADSYIIEKVTELLDYDQGESYTSAAMQYGIDTEPMAIKYIHDVFGGLDLDCTGDEQYFFSDGESGATPDGVEYSEDGFSVCATHEVKCPNGSTHTFNCLKVLTASDLEKHYPCYFHQVLGQLLHTGANTGLWHSFRPSNKTKPLHTIVITRNEVETKINTLKHRLKLASERKNQYLEIFRGNNK